MAGLGYKLFAAGEVLTAGNLQGYAVDQSTMVFATSAARASALAAPSQGMISWLNDSGTAWQYLELYNASTNPGGATAAGWYPYASTGIFHGTATRSAANNTSYNIGAASFLYTEISDTLAWHSAVTNTDRIIPNVAGVYRVNVQAQQTADVNGIRQVQIQRNTVTMAGSTLAASTNSSVGISAAFTLNGSTDYVVATYYQNSGSSLTVNAQVTVEFLRPTSN
jgi:hypothetical protein